MDFCAAMISVSSSGRAFVIQAVVCVLVVCQIWPNMPNMHIWVLIWARQIWSSGVPLKRSCKMQFRRVVFRSRGPSSQKLCPNQIFGWFHGPLFKSGLPLSSMSFHLLDGDSQIALESSAQGCEVIILARETTSFENSS